METLLLVAIALLVLSSRRPTNATGPTAPRAGVQTGPSGATNIVIPGLGSWTQVPGAGSTITFDPRLFAQPEPPVTYTAPDVALPDYTPTYQDAIYATAPAVDPFFYEPVQTDYTVGV